MPLSAALGPVRATTPRDPNRVHPAKSYQVLRGAIRDAGLLNRTPGFYWGLLGALVLGFGGIVTGVILFGNSWFQLLMAGALGILFTQLAFLGHEATHGQIFASWKANEWMGRILANGVVGISYDWWMNKHTRHHGNPNQIGEDPDIEPDTVLFLEDDAKKAKGLYGAFVRRQGWLFFPLITLEGLNLHRHSLWHVLRPGSTAKHRWVEFAALVVRHALYLSAVFLVLPLGMAFAFLGVQLAVFGVYMGASFAPNHKGMPIIPAGENIDFLRKQVLTSRNITPTWWSTMLFGGLNHQVEHHLFPTMARPHLARAREIVRDFCHSEGIVYTETTIRRSYRIIVDYLNQVGLHARDPFECAVAAAHRRR